MTAEKNTLAGRLWFNTKADATTETYVITLWPYRSLSLRGFRIFMAVLASLMSIIATGFFLLGAWPVIGFLGAEILIVWFAFKMNYRAGQLVEKVEITPSYVQITRTNWRGNETQICLDSPWVRAELLEEQEHRPKLFLCAHAQQMEIGSFMPPVEKNALAKALNDALMRVRFDKGAPA
jgi:uncharacterized membrane protein